MVPTDVKYTKDHEWVRIDGASGSMGITDFAQNELGDIVWVELPEVGRAVKTGDVLGSIESVKAVSEVYAPVSGTIEKVNERLKDTPDLVNKDPHGQGWICTIRLEAPGEAQALLDAPAYQALIGTR